MSLVYLCTSKNGKQVSYDPEHSHAATHFVEAKNLKNLVIEVLQDEVLDAEHHKIERDMGRVVGLCELVTVSETDEIIYAKRKNRTTYTKFVKNRHPEPSTMVSIFVDKLPDDTYELFSAWIGRTGEPFPDSLDATPASYDYWKDKALVWGISEVQAGTETNIAPW